MTQSEDECYCKHKARMSTRALRKAQKERERAKLEEQQQQHEEEESDDEVAPRQPVQKSAFAMLSEVGDGEEDEDVDNDAEDVDIPEEQE